MSGFLETGVESLEKTIIQLDSIPDESSFESEAQKRKFYYGAQPVQYFCKENINGLQKILETHENKGMITLLSQEIMCRSSFKFLKVFFEKDKINDKLNLHFIIAYHVENLNESSLTTDVFSADSFVRCTICEQSQLLMHFNKRIKFHNLRAKSQADKIEQIWDYIKIISEEKTHIKKYHDDDLYVERYLTGADYERYCYYVCNIKNNNNKKAVVLFQEYLPRVIKPYFSKLQILQNKILINLDYKEHVHIEFDADKNCILKIRDIEIGKDDVIQITFLIQKRILQFEDYPPDASRGFDLMQMPLFYKFIKEGMQEEENHEISNFDFYKSKNRKGGMKVFSNSMVVMIPQPDFSMPFNVNAVTSTEYAYFLVNACLSILY
jgi:hypothetical protein